MNEWEDLAHEYFEEYQNLKARVAALEAALTAGYEVLLFQSTADRQHMREWLSKDYAVIDAIAALLANAPDAAQKVEDARAAWWKGNVVAKRASDALAATDAEGGENV